MMGMDVGLPCVAGHFYQLSKLGLLRYASFAFTTCADGPLRPRLSTMSRSWLTFGCGK